MIHNFQLERRNIIGCLTVSKGMLYQIQKAAIKLTINIVSAAFRRALPMRASAVNKGLTSSLIRTPT
jgi:hypothetical protein